MLTRVVLARYWKGTMKLPRRTFFYLAAGAVALPTVSQIASAQGYPSRSVRWVVGAPPGGAIDIVARLIGQWLAARLGHPSVSETRPGPNKNTPPGAVVRAPADGYTLLFVGTAHGINASLYDKLNFNF